jgi:uncharacterized protein
MQMREPCTCLCYQTREIMQTEQLSWTKITQEIKQLGSQIKISSFAPDIIIAIPRGGVIPGIILCSILEAKEFALITVKKNKDKRHVIFSDNASFRDKKILLVEDFLETGISLTSAVNYLETRHAYVKTASLYQSKTSEIKPNYCISIRNKPKFPWEINL